MIGERPVAFPYAKAKPAPTQEDPIASAHIDAEVAGNGVVYTLASGRKGFIYAAEVLEYNRDPALLREYMLYELTARARDAIAKSALSRREIIRRLRTSPSQLYRLLDPSNHTKSIDQMVALLQAMDCSVKLSISQPK